MKKRILSIMLSMAVAATLFTGCSSSSSDEAKTTEQSEAENATGKNATHKVGYNYFGAGAYSLNTLSNNIKIVSDVMGQESLAIDDQFSVEQIVSDVENMINSGCDGIAAWLVADALVPTVASMCSDASVYLALSDKVPTDEGVIETLKSNEYFAGACGPDNAVYGQQLAEYALEQGWKTCIITSSSVGDASDTPRLEAFKETFTAGGGEIVDELHADQVQDSLVQVQDSLTANGEVDVIYGTGSDYGVNACTALEDHADWNTKVITSGLDKQALEILNKENSPMAMITGDYWISGFFASVFLQNALEGNTLKDAEGNAIWVDDIQPFEVTAEKYPLYEKYFMNQNVYTDEEIKAMIGISYEDMMKIVKDYNLDNRLMAKYEAGIISADEMKAAGYEVK